MSYRIIIAVALTLVALSSSTPLSIEKNVLARFYSSFAQLYRPASVMSGKLQRSTSTQRYQFLFTEQEYATIKPESMSMLYASVLERSIVYHPNPNFEVEGTRYYYRRDPKQMVAVEIELVRSVDRLFREVKNPNRYFYLPSFDGLEYLRRVPMEPYYELTFICNSSTVNDGDVRAPLLSYIDMSYQWSPRYMLDLPMFGKTEQSEMRAYADLQNAGQQLLVVKGAELTAGDIKLITMPDPYLRPAVSYATTYTNAFSMPLMTKLEIAQQWGERASGAYVFPLRPQSTVVLPPRSTTSIPFFEPQVKVDPFLSYSMLFSTVNSKGKLMKSYNLTSIDAYLPTGRLMLQEQGRFLGELNMPDLSIGEVHTMQFGYDADCSYQRRVSLLQLDESADKITYNVEIYIENRKPSRPVVIDWTESFADLKYFEVNKISIDMEKQPDLVLYGSELRGRFFTSTKKWCQNDQLQCHHSQGSTHYYQ